MNYAKLIDHTLLKPEASRQQIEKLCQEALTHHFASVCVNPTHVALSAKLLAGSDVKVCTVVGFPLGAMTTAGKVFETLDAIKNGATEIDMVVNVGALKEGNYELVLEEFKAMRAATTGLVLKVILETCLLSKEEIVKCCQLAVEAGLDFVKTSTGFSSGGATIEDVALMKKTVGEKAQVKASGGVRTQDDMLKMVEAGATRIGTSNGVALIANQKVSGGY